jgi:hypothetical protein
LRLPASRGCGRRPADDRLASDGGIGERAELALDLLLRGDVLGEKSARSRRRRWRGGDREQSESERKSRESAHAFFLSTGRKHKSIARPPRGE